MSSTITPNMGLTLPTIGGELGPAWASDLNSSLSLIDSHNHTPGNGAQISLSSLAINSDLAMAGFNVSGLRTARFTPQMSTPSGASDLGCLFESGVDLYYKDGSGNVIRLTQGGSIAGAGGTITGLASPASVVLSGGTFTFQQNTNLSANLDCQSIVLRNNVVSSNGLTLSAPTLSSNYQLFLPTIPSAQGIMRLDTAGNMSATLVVDNSSLYITSNTLAIKPLGVTSAMIATGAVTWTTRPARTMNSSSPTIGNIAISSSVGGNWASKTNGSYSSVTNLSVTIVTNGGPVRLSMIADGTTSLGNYGGIGVNGSGGGCSYQYLNSTNSSVGQYAFLSSTSGGTVAPAVHIDSSVAGSAGTYTYVVQAAMIGTATNYSIFNVKLVAEEIC